MVNHLRLNKSVTNGCACGLTVVNTVLITVIACLLLLWLNVFTSAYAQASTQPTPSHNTISGQVFIDTNVNHQADAGEQGLSRQTLVLYDIVQTTCMSTRTDQHGHYTFTHVPTGNYRLYQAYGETIPTPQICNPTTASAPLGYIATTDLVSTTLTIDDNASGAASHHTNINFGVAKQPKLTSDNGGTVFPGDVIFYQHQFSAPAAGHVVFTRDINDPEDWSSLLYHDSDCDGRLTGTEANHLITAPLSTHQGDKICLIHTVFAPESAQPNQQSVVTISAAFTYGHDAYGKARTLTHQLSNSDVTTAAKQLVVGKQTLHVHKTVQNLTQQTPVTQTRDDARPGDTLLYRITYRNTGNAPIAMTELEMQDAVPAFSTLDASSARCEDTPTTLTCTPDTSGDPDLIWYFSGQLTAGGQGSVTFAITVE